MIIDCTFIVCSEFTVCLLSRSVCTVVPLFFCKEFILHEIVKYKFNNLHVLIFLHVVFILHVSYSSILVGAVGLSYY